MLKRLAGIAPLALTLAGLFVAPPAAQAARMFCCVDEAGSRFCGDSLPAACRSRAYTEFNERGARIRDAEAPLSEAQLAARDAEDRKKADSDRMALDQKRRDEALLATYASESDLDLAKSRALADQNTSIKQYQERLDETLKIKADLQNKVAALKGQPTPADLAEKLRNNNLEIQSHQREIETRRKDLERVTAKYEAERKRFRELRGQRSGQNSGPQMPGGDLPQPALSAPATGSTASGTATGAAGAPAAAPAPAPATSAPGAR